MPFAATRQVAPGDPRELEHQIALFRAEIANLAAHMQIDGQARLQYDTRIRQMAEELAQRARRGEITWNDAAAAPRWARPSRSRSSHQASTSTR
jgi:hypothetical protein